jgi:hypothetical protein
VRYANRFFGTRDESLVIWLRVSAHEAFGQNKFMMTCLTSKSVRKQFRGAVGVSGRRSL